MVDGDRGRQEHDCKEDPVYDGSDTTLVTAELPTEYGQPPADPPGSSPNAMTASVPHLT